MSFRDTRANVLSPLVACSRIDFFKSAAIGARSWSLMRVLVLTVMALVPSEEDSGRHYPPPSFPSSPGLSSRFAPGEAIVRLGNRKRASCSVSALNCPLLAWSLNPAVTSLAKVATIG